LLFPQTIALRAKGLNLGLHSSEQKLSRGRINGSPLEFEDVLSLPPHLEAHSLDFRP
jgi:hypothetical protein